MPSRTREVIEQWLDARSSCDLERLATLTAREATWDSPVAGASPGRRAVVEQVRDGFADTEDFASEVLALECRDDRAVAVIHNKGRRGGESLDSLQTLFMRVTDGLVTEVRIAVDDPEAVENFWARRADGPG